MNGSVGRVNLLVLAWICRVDYVNERLKGLFCFSSLRPQDRADADYPLP
jgi:hypothetical protein